MTSWLPALILLAADPAPRSDSYRAEVRIRPEKTLRTIPEAIYGVAEIEPEQLKAYGLSITRWGGNRSSRYNWQRNCDNAGADWYFLNGGTPINDPLRSGYLEATRSNRRLGAGLYLTVPMIGWVAKDATSYGFSVEKYGPQKAHEPGKPNVGNGIKPDGSPVTGNDPRDTSVAVGADFIGAAVKLCREQLGPSNRGGVAYWALDNEPMLWHKTHRDVFPEPLGYDGLWLRTVAYAEAIKNADPSAKVAGFVSWGWLDLLYSARDEVPDRPGYRPDFEAHGQVPLVEWFLRNLGDYHRKNGRRLIDVLDFHWYPQGQVDGQGIYLGKPGHPELQALRLRSVRELWDPNYVSESWIKDVTPEPLRVIPRLRAWIEKYDRGLELAIGEYNFGGTEDVSGGLAQADLFGVFAREGLDQAFLWTKPTGSQQRAWDLFRNYDGRGGRFGQQLVEASSSANDLSVYASRGDAGVRTIILINKHFRRSCRATLDLGGPIDSVRMWRFDARHTDALQSIEVTAPTNGRDWELSFPPASASILELRVR